MSIICVGIDVHKDSYYVSSFLRDKNLIFAQTQMKSTTENVVKYLKAVKKDNSNCEFVIG